MRFGKSESAWRRYGLMTAAVVVAVLAKLLLDPFIVEQEPFLLFLAVVTLSAWYGGFLPGLLATLLTGIAAEYFFIGEYYGMQWSHFVTDIRLVVFMAEGIAISGLVSTVHAAIAQKRQSQQRYQRIVETAQEGIWLFDSRWRTRFANTALAAMLGCQPADVAGRTIFDFMDQEDRAAAEGDLSDGIGQSSRKREFKFRRSDGAIVWTVVTMGPIAEQDASSGWLAMVSDITTRKEAEQELARHREHLEELVTQRTRALEESFDRLRQSERMAGLGTLAAGLGHDMGNLLMPLNLRIERLESRPMSPETQDDVEAVRACAEYLQSLTTGLRLLSSNPDEAGSWGESTDLKAWWPDVFRFLRNALPRGANLEVRFEDALPPVRVPRHLLTQAVFNLVHNAGQAMNGRRGTVCVWAKVGKDDRTVQLGVTDDGPGMDEQTRRRCLEPFFSTKKRPESLGLGLALVQLIVQKAGGALAVQSALGEGTTFTLTLPAAALVGAAQTN